MALASLTLASSAFIDLTSAAVAAPAAAGLPAGPQVPVLDWRGCHQGFQCATARVPLDYQHPHGTLVRIAVIRHRAADPARRIGTLFVNGGGPLEQIEPFLAEFPAIPAVLRDRFDIITFDPRGFGFSSPVRCFASATAENRLLAPVLPFPLFPVGAAQTAVFERTYRRFDARCARTAGSLLDHDSTADVARDLDLIRRAVGARRLNYIGLSYGTGLGAVYANLFPARTGRMVLDGNLDPVAWTRGTLPTFARLRQGQAAATATRTFLSLCGRQPSSRCAFSARTAAATRAKFALLLRRLRAKPVTIGSQKVTYADVFEIVPPSDVSEWQDAAGQLQQIWLATAARHSTAARVPSQFTTAASPAAARSGAPYAGLDQSFGELCADSPNPRSPHAYVAAAKQLAARYGGFGVLAVWTSEVCAPWPVAAGRDRYRGPWNRATATAILVIGNTGDPVTSYRDSVAMAHDLGRARLLTVDGFGHTEFFNPSACASRYEFRYLTTGMLPPPRKICRQSIQPFPAS